VYRPILIQRCPKLPSGKVKLDVLPESWIRIKFLEKLEQEIFLGPKRLHYMLRIQTASRLAGEHTS